MTLTRQEARQVLDTYFRPGRRRTRSGRLTGVPPCLLPGHELGIVPSTVASPIALASGFVLYDGDLAVVETITSRLQIADPAITARYARRLELLRQTAITGVQPQNYAARSQANSRWLPIQRASRSDSLRVAD